MRKLLILLGLIAFILVAIYCVYNHRLTIQDDIQSRVSQGLVDINAVNVTASTNGRDVTLSGNVESREEEQILAKKVLGIDGVRKVISNVAVTPGRADLIPVDNFDSLNADNNMDEQNFSGDDFGLNDAAPSMQDSQNASKTIDLTANNTAPQKSAANVKCEKDIADIMEGQTIKFSTGSSKIDTSSMNLIKEIARAAKNCPTAEAIIVHGHTDNVGNSKSNMDLSVKRAVSVGQQLKLAGVEQRVDGVGHGDLTPIASNDTAQGRAQNRRIEFEVK